MDGWELRARRRAERLTLQQVARAAGTAETNVAAYERGRKHPSARTLSRLTTMIDAGGDSPIHRRSLLTVPATAAAIRHALRANWTTADMLRVIRENRSNAAFIESERDRAAFFAEPSTTGDPRWDAMIAGNAEDLALRDGFAAPDWSRGHALPQFWFVGSTPSLAAFAFARSPFSLQLRGVMVDPADLEAV
jgi:transcriptional regulator with XRE-family HTH domain